MSQQQQNLDNTTDNSFDWSKAKIEQPGMGGSAIKSNESFDWSKATVDSPAPAEPGMGAKAVKWINDHTTFGKIGKIVRQRQIAEGLSAEMKTIPMEEITSKRLDTQEGLNAEINRRYDIWDKEIERKGMAASGQDMMTGLAGMGVVMAPGVIAGAKVVGGVASFMGLDHYINLRRWAETHMKGMSNNVYDAIEAVDLVGKAAAIGGAFGMAEETGKGIAENFGDALGLKGEVPPAIKAQFEHEQGVGPAKEALGKLIEQQKKSPVVPVTDQANHLLKAMNAPDTVKLTTEQSEVIAKNPDAMKTLGIDQSHIDQSKASGSPIAVSRESLLNLRNKPYWDKIKDAWNVDIEILNKKLKTLPDQTPLKDRINLAKQSTGVWQGTLAKAKGALQGIRNVGAAVKNWYFNEHIKWGDTEGMIRKYVGDRAISQYQTEQFAEEIIRSVPDETQEGIINWIQAGGDKKVLQEWADKTTDPKLKAGYTKAMNFTPEEEEFADMCHRFYQTKLDEAQEAGVLENGFLNYVNGIWDEKSIKGNGAYKGFIAQVQAGLLKPKQDFMKRKVFSNYFEGEQLGFVPKDKRIGYTIAAYNQAFDEAIASRKFIKDAFEGKAEDGRPLVTAAGGGHKVDVVDPQESSPWLIKPKTEPEDTFDYRYYDHPALRKWKFIGKDSGDNPILVEGDALLHPDFYHKFHALVGKSAAREGWWGKYLVKPLLVAGREVKGTILSLSAFHQVQESVHGLSHKVNPLTLENIDLKEGSLDRDLIEHGMMIGHHSALEEFSEGVAGSGLINKLPKIGPYMQKYQEYLFENYIPRLKAAMARDAFGRNTKRYSGKLNRDQVLRLSADESNFAFGELNWKAMGTNPAMLDVMRIGLLAPDFLLARVGFAGQALRPYGKEQFAAIFRQATVMYAGARVLNMAINKGDAHWDKPFSVVVGKKEYTLRSVVGDMTHLVTDPRSFMFHRLAPMVSGGYEIASTRNIWGRKETLKTAVQNNLKRMPPIPLQGLFSRHQDKLIYDVLDSVTASLGISGFEYHTPAEQEARNINFDKIPEGIQKDSEETRYLDRHNLEGEYKKEHDKTVLSNAVNEGKITRSDMTTIIKETNMGDLEKAVQKFTVDEIQRVYDKGNKEEKKILEPYVEKKIQNSKKFNPAQNAKMKREQQEKYKRDFKNE